MDEATKALQERALTAAKRKDAAREAATQRTIERSIGQHNWLIDGRYVHFNPPQSVADIRREFPAYRGSEIAPGPDCL